MATWNSAIGTQGPIQTTFSNYFHFWAFYEHIISHLTISYSFLVIYMIAITIRQCVYLFYNVCPVILVILVIYHATVYSLSRFYVPIL